MLPARDHKMRNLCTTISCLVTALTIFGCHAVPLLSGRRKQDSKLKTFTDRYALPTNVHSLTAKLPLTFGYRFTDDYGTIQSREEKTDPNGFKTGSYSFVDATGIYRRVEYVADHHGFRATVTTNEPGTMSVDPANVRMLTENKNVEFGPQSHSFGNMPQLEYSSNIFSRSNLSTSYDRNKDKFHGSDQNLGRIRSKLLDSKSPVFESERAQLEKPKFFTTNKGSSLSFSPAITSILQDLDDPEPIIYDKKFDSVKYFVNPDISPNFSVNDKFSSVGYAKKVPTRYPRKHRDSRARSKKRQAVKIHIPQGYEDHDDLPLYRDK